MNPEKGESFVSRPLQKAIGRAKLRDIVPAALVLCALIHSVGTVYARDVAGAKMPEVVRDNGRVLR